MVAPSLIGLTSAPFAVLRSTPERDYVFTKSVTGNIRQHATTQTARWQYPNHNGNTSMQFVRDTHAAPWMMHVFATTSTMQWGWRKKTFGTVCDFMAEDNSVRSSLPREDSTEVFLLLLASRRKTNKKAELDTEELRGHTARQTGCSCQGRPNIRQNRENFFSLPNDS